MKFFQPPLYFCELLKLRQKYTIPNDLYRYQTNSYTTPFIDLSDGSYPHKFCDKFYECENGNLFVKSCADGLEYNPSNQACDWPGNNTNDECKKPQ